LLIACQLTTTPPFCPLYAGATPLHLACKPWKGQEGCIAALLDAEGVELAATDRMGQVALHYAARFGNSPAIRALLGAGADATYIDLQGHTPLDVALEAGHQGAVEVLLPPEDKTPTPPHSSIGAGPRTPQASHAVTPSGISLDNLSTTPSAPPLLDLAGPSSSIMAGPSSSSLAGPSSSSMAGPSSSSMAGPSSSSMAGTSNGSGNSSSDLCVVCLDNPRQTVLVPCGHRALCTSCAYAQRSRHCPICRSNILSCVRVFDA
jgi:ankyrin repeat protein